MLVVECRGTPYEIGHQHGSAAKLEVGRCIDFYGALFQKNCKQTWTQVLETASSFEQHIRVTWPAYHEEMRGVADGAGVELLDIVALNVRTEVAFGQFSDGCTSLAWHTEKRVFLGQNWDWMDEQKNNLIITKITQSGKPAIQQITEAGIIGKIGFNSSGVGTLLNAIKVKGVDPSRMPVHLGLRMALESNSAMEAVQKLESYGMASSAHILIADTTTAVGLEFTKSTFARCLPDSLRRVVHANHFLLEHPGEVDTVWLEDSPVRVKTMTENSSKVGDGQRQPTWEEVGRLFEDEQNYPTAICRAEEAGSGTRTLFNILTDLKTRTAVIRKGLPTKVEETVTMSL
ncbi:peptidase C45 acyl-coenzyme A:6-aminopenicillanic acid acyl-transferas-like protein [Lindgomyces ingoldianus]|uniref:Peptidase C45 acyl-coenzyme A:6-aminopenicillanic acid acyl-transferas-like protein n=1 Tax=Lindgomyces ingoldianus TaxID=673940 RepID=A0ACB6RG62_9PLEO|nr:peptidase C45 acyl-coenzyme A:6-aminopenicillanic acid acyl-transferas-like protein [Lindgomyces ingoldianus]KAF2477492.1 peptidase C45 acyl-coenzyme A:6-aminopenicillanic acid acyl-transferas-like protein [Lindgomyces ingoldianus]